MVTDPLTGLRLLIVEDEYYLAEDARTVLIDGGAEVLGPVATAAQARALIEGDPAIDGVLLDINLRGEMAFDVADMLQARAIPFAFVTGYDPLALPGRFAATPRLEKPLSGSQLLATVETLGLQKGTGGSH